MGAVGTPTSRVDGPTKVTGTARYAAEHAPAGLVYAAIVESTVPAGRIVGLDTAAAEQSVGVLLVLTHRNAERLPYLQADQRPPVDPVSGEQLRVLQDDRVLFRGQPIGVVVAATQAQAEHAAALVRVDYDLDPAPRTRFGPEWARPTSAAAQKAGRGPETRQGDPDTALAAAAHRVDHVYVQPREQHHAMEPHATVAHWQDGHLTLWDKTQWVGNVRDEIARVFGIPPGTVRVINPFVGGAFGSALRPWPHVALAALAARRTGRPVRLELTRRQLAQSVGFRPHTEQRVALGADTAGTLTAIIHEAIGQTSTYEEFAEGTLTVPQVTYASPNRRTSYRLVAMNTNTPCPMRGPGWATGLLAQEMAMDELAVELRMDPIQLRLRNYADHDPRNGRPWSSNALRECYRLGAQRMGWDTRDPRPARTRAGHDLVGLGMATALYHSNRYPTQASATLLADGTAVIASATSDMGPGTYTSISQVAADTLGLPLDRVRMELGDSDLPPAKEHGGSTTMASVGTAVHAACQALRAQLDDLARQQAGADVADGARSDAPVDLVAVLRRAGLTHVRADGHSEPGPEQQTHSSVGFGAVFAEVRVDADLGTVRVPRIIGAYDIGRVVNPTLAHSQVIGGMVGGLGMALLEQVDWDPHLGQVMNGNLAEYLLPVNADVQQLDAVFVPGEDITANPLGVKGVAELGLCAVAPAIANAVWHATGTRLRELPLTPEKVLPALPVRSFGG